jgi:alkanesulfonate monooxygenase SsuD/methylene tetrahydromethanopterin reductase-like flavin-dependent oxidoreductase (luciferase family)
VASIRAAAAAAGRPEPVFSARVRVEYGRAADGFALRGTPEEMAAEVRAFAEAGVTHLALTFATTDPAELVARVERFAREVVPLVD